MTTTCQQLKQGPNQTQTTHNLTGAVPKAVRYNPARQLRIVAAARLRATTTHLSGEWQATRAARGRASRPRAPADFLVGFPGCFSAARATHHHNKHLEANLRPSFPRLARERCSSSLEREWEGDRQRDHPHRKGPPTGRQVMRWPHARAQAHGGPRLARAATVL